jgi:integrase
MWYPRPLTLAYDPGRGGSAAVTQGKEIRTDPEIRALKCPPEVARIDVPIRDPKLPGFGIRVYRGGRKVFFLLYRFQREKKRLKLGIYSPPAFGLAAARIRASDQLASIIKGENPAADIAEARHAEDVKTLYETFETEVVRKFPKKTQANWSGTSKRFLTEIGHLPITATDEICDRVLALHKRIGLEEKKETLALTLFKHVGRFFRWAVDERKLKVSQFPLGGIRSRFKDRKRTRYYDPDEIRRLLAATNDPKTWWPEDTKPEEVTDLDRLRAAVHRGYFLLLWYVGCRRGALAAMRWDEIRPDHVSLDEWLWYRPTSKNDDPLEIPLSSYAKKVLDELGEITGTSGFVFASQRKDGKTGHRSDSWKPVTRLQAASKVHDFTNHAVRKTISTYMTRTLDVPTDVVTAILNHRLTGPKSNENYIQALPVGRMREALERWGQHLAAIASDAERKELRHGSRAADRRQRPRSASRSVIRPKRDAR